jgi:peptidoglycan/xylan/chitin deacetylase (PgdA/CDA1 family)
MKMGLIVTTSDKAVQPFNILTIDVEEWYHLNYASMQQHQGQSFASRVQANTETLLETLKECRAQATFFVLGSVAERYPGLVSAAHTMGHEIASHGYGHELVYNQSRSEFYQDVKRSLNVLGEIT